MKKRPVDRRKRISLSLPDDIKLEFDKAAEIMGINTTTLCIEILVEAAPTIVKMAKSIEKAKLNALGGLTQMSEVLAEAASKAAQGQLTLAEAVSEEVKKSARKPK